MNHQTSDIFENGGLDERAKAYLLETARWTKFLAIIGFISIGFLVLFAIASLSVGGMNTAAYPIVTFLYCIVMGVVYIYPAVALVRFSRLVKTGVHNNNQEDLTEAFRYQKNLYKYMGILVIIGLVLILLGMIAGGFLAATYRP